MTTKQVSVGGVLIGGGAPISIQSMCNTDTRDAKATLEQIERLADAGCEIVRAAIPDMEAARSFGIIKRSCPLPLVADIHFDYRLAIAAIDEGADKIRINPGNMRPEDARLVLEKANAAGIPVRIGVNGGSLEKQLIEKYHGVCAQALCESALNAVEFCCEAGFTDTVVSVKSSDVKMNFEAHKLLSQKTDRPLHIGLTESGTGEAAMIKSIAGLSPLLLNGIGDTMRISLTGDPVSEVVLAKKLLRAVGIRRSGIDFVSCPTCGRTRVELERIAGEVSDALRPIDEKLSAEGRFLRVAVMGCEVNGPGEAANADIGVACGKDVGLIFKKGEIVKKVDAKDICNELVQMTLNMI